MIQLSDSRNLEALPGCGQVDNDFQHGKKMPVIASNE